MNKMIVESSDEEENSFNSEASSPGETPPARKRMQKQASSSSSDESDEEETKQPQPQTQTNGRGPQSEQQQQQQGTTAIRDHLQCPLCMELMIRPVTVSCGHSFCRLCLVSAITSGSSEFFGRFRCPICRRVACTKCCKRLEVNTCLWAVVQDLFKNDLGDLKQEELGFEKALAKLLDVEVVDAAVDGLSPVVREEACKIFDRALFERSVIRDPNDRAMHLTLALFRDPDPFPPNIRKGAFAQVKNWKICFALLELEEDEDMENGGFPGMLRGQGEASGFLVKTSYTGQYNLAVYINMNPPRPRSTQRDDEEEEDTGDQIETEGWELKLESSVDVDNGIVKFEVDPRSIPKGCKQLKVECHSENYEQLIATVTLEELTTRPLQEMTYNKRIFQALAIDLDGNPVSEDIEHSEDENEESDINEFENDGFVVDDEDDIEFESDEEREQKKKKKKKLERKKKEKKVISDSEEDDDEKEEEEESSEEDGSSEEEEEKNQQKQAPVQSQSKYFNKGKTRGEMMRDLALKAAEKRRSETLAKPKSPESSSSDDEEQQGSEFRKSFANFVKKEKERADSSSDEESSDEDEDGDTGLAKFKQEIKQQVQKIDSQSVQKTTRALNQTIVEDSSSSDEDDDDDEEEEDEGDTKKPQPKPHDDNDDDDDEESSEEEEKKPKRSSTKKDDSDGEEEDEEDSFEEEEKKPKLSSMKKDESDGDEEDEEESSEEEEKKPKLSSMKKDESDGDEEDEEESSEEEEEEKPKLSSMKKDESDGDEEDEEESSEEEEEEKPKLSSMKKDDSDSEESSDDDDMNQLRALFPGNNSSKPQVTKKHQKSDSSSEDEEEEKTTKKRTSKKQDSSSGEEEPPKSSHKRNKGKNASVSSSEDEKAKPKKNDSPVLTRKRKMSPEKQANGPVAKKAKPITAPTPTSSKYFKPNILSTIVDDSSDEDEDED